MIHVTSTIIGMPQISRRKPDFNMLGSAIWPLAQAIALGPVPEGSIKPQLAASAAGIASSTGSAPVAKISAAITGMTPLAVATFEANSVISTTSPVTASAMTMTGTRWSGSSASPSHVPSPESMIPEASAARGLATTAVPRRMARD